MKKAEPNMDSIIFYPENEEELKNSLMRYLTYARKEQVIDEVTIKDSYKYFDLIYPARYKNRKLYFIFGKDPYQPQNNINQTGLLLSALLDLESHQKEFEYELYILKFQKEVFNLAHFPLSKENKQNSQTTEHNIFIEYTLEKDQNVEINKDYNIDHPHKIIGDDIAENIKKFLTFESENLASESNQQDNRNIKSCHILIIDDVLGDYNKKFYPFYVWLKRELIKINNYIPIIRGIPEPTKLIDCLSTYPLDIVLVDIDFSKHFEEVKKNPDSFYHRKIREILSKDNDVKENDFEKKGALILGFVILDQLRALLEKGIGEINNDKNCRWYILTGYDYKSFEGIMLQEKWIKKGDLIGGKKQECLKKLKPKKFALDRKRAIRKIILALKYLNIDKMKDDEVKELFKSYGFFENTKSTEENSENENELLKNAVKLKKLLKAYGFSNNAEKALKRKEAENVLQEYNNKENQDVDIYTGEEDLTAEDFLDELLKKEENNEQGTGKQ